MSKGLWYFHRWRILKSIQYFCVLFLDSLSKSLISDFGKEMKGNQAYYAFEELVFLKQKCLHHKSHYVSCIIELSEQWIYWNVACCSYICQYKCHFEVLETYFFAQKRNQSPIKYFTLHWNGDIWQLLTLCKVWTYRSMK